jgi:integrase
MRGSIKRRSAGSWTIVLDLPRDGSGKRRQKRTTVRGTRRDAEQEAARLVHEIEHGILPPSRLTIRDLLQKWLAECDGHCAAKTVERYRSIAQLHIEPVLGHLKVGKLRAQHINDAVSAWRAQPRNDHKKGTLTGTSVRHNFDVLRCALNYGIRMGLLVWNPCCNVKAPTRDDREIAPLDVEAAKKLFRSISISDLLLAVVLAIGTGLRRGELLALRWCDVGMPGRVLHISRAVEHVKGTIRIKTPKTKKSRRVIALTTLALQALRAQYANQCARDEQLGIDPPEPSALVFGQLGEIWSPGAFSLAFYRAVKKAKIPHVRFHDLRHSFASILLAAGVDLKVISEMLGHAGIAITADRYAHLSLEGKRDAAQRFDEQFPIDVPAEVAREVAHVRLTMD